MRDLFHAFFITKKDLADPKVLNFKKVYMIPHRRSGLLISKFAL